VNPGVESEGSRTQPICILVPLIRAPPAPTFSRKGRRKRCKGSVDAHPTPPVRGTHPDFPSPINARHAPHPDRRAPVQTSPTLPPSRRIGGPPGLRPWRAAGAVGAGFVGRGSVAVRLSSPRKRGRGASDRPPSTKPMGDHHEMIPGMGRGGYSDRSRTACRGGLPAGGDCGKARQRPPGAGFRPNHPRGASREAETVNLSVSGLRARRSARPPTPAASRTGCPTVGDASPHYVSVTFAPPSP
jgi:hypothetical protein